MSLKDPKGSVMRRVGAFEAEARWTAKGEIELLLTDSEQSLHVQEKVGQGERVALEFGHTEALALVKVLQHALRGGQGD